MLLESQSYRSRESEKGRELSVYWFTAQMASQVRAGPGDTAGSPTWAVRAKMLE